MRIFSLVAAGVLCLSLAGPVHGMLPVAGAQQQIGKRSTNEKQKPVATAPAKSNAKTKTPGKSDDSSLGSAARREALKNRAQDKSKAKNAQTAKSAKSKQVEKKTVKRRT